MCDALSNWTIPELCKFATQECSGFVNQSNSNTLWESKVRSCFSSCIGNTHTCTCTRTHTQDSEQTRLKNAVASSKKLKGVAYFREIKVPPSNRTFPPTVGKSEIGLEDNTTSTWQPGPAGGRGPDLSNNSMVIYRPCCYCEGRIIAECVTWTPLPKTIRQCFYRHPFKTTPKCDVHNITLHIETSFLNCTIVLLIFIYFCRIFLEFLLCLSFNVMQKFHKRTLLACKN